jgi:LysM repeat protein
LINIGGIKLEGLAAPEYWPHGGSQKISVKELTGGSITYQPRGFFHLLEHSWEGVLDGNQAKKKADALNKICLEGKSVEVKYDIYTFRYFIQDFEYDWVRPDWIEFKIKVLKDTTPVKEKKKAAPDPVKKALDKKPSPAPSTKKIIHVVKKGESLRRIARDLLGDENQFEKIFKDNKGQIKNPNLIFPGQKLVINK